jgi:hypothetical protein
MTAKPFVSGYQGLSNPGVAAVIPISTALSAAIPTGGMSLVGIFLPAALTGTTISFQACDTLAGTYVDVKSSTSGTLLSYTVAAGTYCAIDPKDFHGIQFLKIKSGSTELAARTLICTLKGF